jgi:hypothetical protein
VKDPFQLNELNYSDAVFGDLDVDAALPWLLRAEDLLRHDMPAIHRLNDTAFEEWVLDMTGNLDAGL